MSPGRLAARSRRPQTGCRATLRQRSDAMGHGFRRGRASPARPKETREAARGGRRGTRGRRSRRARVQRRRRGAAARPRRVRDDPRLRRAAVLPRRAHRAARGLRGQPRAHAAGRATRPSSSPRRRSRPPREPDAGLRLYWTGSTLVATVAEIPPELEERRARGLRLVSLRLGVEPGPPGWLLPGVKSTSYAVNMAGEAEARSRGADDAVFLANGDIVLEAPISNVWWRHGDMLCTPRRSRSACSPASHGRRCSSWRRRRATASRKARSRSTPARRRGGLHLVVDPRGHPGDRARRQRRSADGSARRRRTRAPARAPRPGQPLRLGEAPHGGSLIDGRGQDPARWHGSRERRARPRADVLGVRRAHARRSG